VSDKVGLADCGRAARLLWAVYVRKWDEEFGCADMSLEEFDA